MKRKTMTLLLTLCLVLTLTACTQTTDQGTSGAAHTGSTTLPALETMADAEYIEMGSDRIPSVKSVIGQRTLINLSAYSSYPDGSMTVTFNYSCDPNNPTQATSDIDTFTQYLLEKTAFEKKNDAGSESENQTEQIWSAASADSSMEISLCLIYNTEGYTLSITKMPAQGSVTADVMEGNGSTDENVPADGNALADENAPADGTAQ